MKYWQPEKGILYNGEGLEVLKTLPDESVNCVITSPPYWGLRDYGTGIWEGGNPKCNHSKKTSDKESSSTLGSRAANVNHEKEGWVGGICKKCGAKRIDKQLGLEKTFQEYIDRLCNIFDEVKRVLTKDGTVWVNIGDTYGGANSRASDGGRAGYGNDREGIYSRGIDKSLCQIPSRFAIEMTNRGWILRNEIIWYKKNCMPSSVKDRFTVDFEKIFMFVKNKKYYFEQQFENLSESTLNDSRLDNVEYKTQRPERGFPGKKQQGSGLIQPNEGGRNKRTVWNINTKSFSEAHFAVFPEALVEIPIKAGCPKYICKKCGKAREKIFDNSERINTRVGKNTGSGKSGKDYDPNKEMHNGDLSKYRQQIIYKDKGYTDCGCNAGFKSGTVMDPFVGSGTVPKVAKKNNLNWIGIDLNKDFCAMTKRGVEKTECQFNLFEEAM